MNKADLIDALAAKTNTSKKQAGEAIDALGEAVSTALAKGDEVTLPGIGKLIVKSRAAREGRNPATGEAIKIKAKKVPHFVAAKALKDAVD